MKSILKKIFIDHWQRKLLALIIAIITWFFINNSLTVTKTVSNVSIRATNLASERTIRDMLPGGILAEDTSITITGSQNFINQITSSDFEVVVDLKDQTNNFTTHITKNHLASKNPNINIERSIKKIKPQEITIKISRLVKEKIPVRITKPIGEAPKGYQFLDIWPYQLYTTLKGPEEIIKELKTKGQQLTFNLNDISQKQLDVINAANKRGKKDIVSFFIPTAWKKLSIPSLSPYPIEIDDQNAKALRLDFIKNDLIPINSSIPITLYFPVNSSEKLNPNNITLANNNFIKKINDINMITTPLYAQGASELFIDIIKERMQIIIVVQPNEEQELLYWNIQPIIPIELEKAFVDKILSQETDEVAKEMEPHMREDYLKVRFRAYMNKFRLWFSENKKLNLNITLKDNKIYVIPNN